VGQFAFAPPTSHGYNQRMRAWLALAVGLAILWGLGMAIFFGLSMKLLAGAIAFGGLVTAWIARRSPAKPQEGS
jgi:hypothetical protein